MSYAKCFFYFVSIRWHVNICGSSGECVHILICMCVAHYIFVCKQAWGGGINMKDNYQEEVGTQMKGLILILEKTWQLAWMFYFLRIVCFCIRRIPFFREFWRQHTLLGEDKSRANCLETEMGCGMYVTPSAGPLAVKSLERDDRHSPMYERKK